MKKPLSARQAAACEGAKNPRCRCRCGGTLHGSAHKGLVGRTDGPLSALEWEMYCPACQEPMRFLHPQFPSTGFPCPVCKGPLVHLDEVKGPIRRWKQLSLFPVV